MNYDKIMNIALNTALNGVKKNELPFGAALCNGEDIVAVAHNLTMSTKNSRNHAEVVCINSCDKEILKNDNLTLFCTCEPCEDCFEYAIKNGIKHIVYGSEIETAIKLGSGDKLFKVKNYEKKYNIKIENNVLKNECDELLKKYYDKEYLAQNIVKWSSGTEEEKFWMKKALEIAKQGMKDNDELPIGVIIVAGDEILSESSTLTYSLNSPITHGDFMAMLKAERDVYSCKRPLVLYSTLEPHLIGFSAAIKCKFDKVVFGLEAKPDGGSIYLPHIIKLREWIPETIGGVCAKEQYELFKEFVNTHSSNRVGYDYALSVINAYEKSGEK